MKAESNDLHYWQILVNPVYLTYPALLRPYTLTTYQVSKDNVVVI